MRATRTLETDAPIAPAEIRELIARLTEQSVESVPAYESRTLEGLALEMGLPLARLRMVYEELHGRRAFSIPPAAWVGFALLAFYAGWLVSHPIPGQAVLVEPPAATVPMPTVDLRDTVPLSSVTYGPDGGNLSVDPNFEPSTPLPEGLSLSVTAGEILWGAGDHHARALVEPLTPEDERSVEADVVELLKYVRREAARRKVAFPGGRATVQAFTYFGSASVDLPLPPPGKGDAAAANAIRRAAKGLVERIQTQIRSRMQMYQDQGP